MVLLGNYVAFKYSISAYSQKQRNPEQNNEMILNSKITFALKTN